MEPCSIGAPLNEPLASAVVATALLDDPSRLATYKSVFFSEEILLKNVRAEVAAAATVAAAECKSGAVMSRDNYTLGFAFTSMCHSRGNWPCQPDQLCSWAMIGLGGGYNRRRKWRKTPVIFPEGRGAARFYHRRAPGTLAAARAAADSAPPEFYVPALSGQTRPLGNGGIVGADLSESRTKGG